jgi:hypothetical protein
MVQLAKHVAFGIVALLCLLTLYIDISRSWPDGLTGLLFINIPLYMLPTIIAGYRVHPEYSGRRDAKLASWLDRSRMGGRARVELRKTSPTVGN